MNVLYQQRDFPIFQNRMYGSREEAINCPKGDVVLIENELTGLVYNAAFRSEMMVYDDQYQNEQAVSPLFQSHLRDVQYIIDSRMGRSRLAEVGCGKGYFLETLLQAGFDITGFDPTYEGSSPRIQREYFGPGTVEKADGLILRHVLEHIENPVDFLFQLSEANERQGLIYIEVPCFDWICEHRAWFDIFYEHVNYFRLVDFDRMFGRTIESGRLFGGQYLYVVADLATLREPEIDLDNRVILPEDFMGSIDATLSSVEHQAVVWGGASKGVIFSLLKARRGDPVDLVVDINPSKQGKFLAGTGLMVMSPEVLEASILSGATIYVMNSNYLEEIRQMTNNKYEYVGVIDE